MIAQEKQFRSYCRFVKFLKEISRKMKTCCVFLLVALTTSITDVFGHASMVSPITWFDYPQWVKTKDGWKFDYVGMKSQQQCTAGATTPPEIICQNTHDCGAKEHSGGSCLWFNNYTFIEKPTLFDSKLRTYAHNEYPQYVLHHPWRAPGAAPLDSPCGVAGGNFHGCGGPKCGQDQGGYAYGKKAENVDFQHPIHITNWTRGDIVEVAWGIRANHGGGYSYRLCKLPEEGRKALTEECFQQTPLKFYGDKQWVQYGEDKSKRVVFNAVRTNHGTTPPGSQWTKNPIPACNGLSGGFNTDPFTCSKGTQFTPPAPGLFGFGIEKNDLEKKFEFSVVDKVIIPKTLPAGDYVISFRWDCEQTPQVWNTCSSVRLH